ncbi:alpha/beta hydrolase [Paenibacillus lacisoli]|nr:alpha/beta fold hydrolase [Paenibacillus sp. JX-17]
MEREFSCVRDGLTIRGREFRPQGDQLPAVIISHGFGGSLKDLVHHCLMFASWGYAAYGFDFCGGSANGEGISDGESTDMTLLTECEDLHAVMNVVQELPYVDAHRLTLMGFSQGGLVSALAAAQRADEVESLILIYPAFCIPDDARRGALLMSSYDITDVPEFIDAGYMMLGKTFHETVVHMNPYTEITPFKGPVLLIHGTADEPVHPRYALKAKESYESGQCQLQLIQAAGHGFTEEQTAAVSVSIRQFLLGHKEILTIHVQITGSEVRKDFEAEKEIAIFFTGDCDSPYFTGRIIDGADDVQEYAGDQLVTMRADYMLEGMDYNGKKCQLHIVNQNVNGEWKPKVNTDSKALNFLNHSNMTAVLEGYPDGLTVRIFSAIP